jgi:hypothetical protein
MLALAALILALGTPGRSWAKAPNAMDVMQPVDTSPGSFSDPKKLLEVDLNKIVTVGISAAPAEIAYNQISALLGIEWGFAPGISQNQEITLNVSGPAHKVMKALGEQAGVRFEAGGPTQIRVVAARKPAPPKAKNPPPAQHP